MTAASQVELHPGSTTETGFLKTDSGYMFYVLERPHSAGDFAVLVCSPLYSERLKNNRREVLLTRGLAQQGMPTLRFHYLGTGNSDDNPNGPTVQSMVRDASRAADLLATQGGAPVTVVVGTRLGATIAAHADHGADYFAFWDPAMSGKSYMREVLRAHIIVAMKAGRTVSTSDLSKLMEDEGYVDVVGFAIRKSLSDSGQDFALPTDARNVRGLHTTLFRNSEIAKAEQRSLDRWATNLDEPMTVLNADFEEGWWFHQNTNLLTPDETELLDRRTMDTTAAWIRRVGSPI